MEFTRKNLDRLIPLINQKDLIAISGGGWLGSEWKHDEIFVRSIIKALPNNFIMIFLKLFIIVIKMNSLIKERRFTLHMKRSYFA